MKRLPLFLFLFLAIAALTGFTSSRLGPKDSAVQFQGTVKYTNGNDAPVGTIVKVYLGSTLKANVQLYEPGYYELPGDPLHYPTGTYTLRADDQIGMLGDKDCYKAQYSEGTACNIVLNTAY
jgi:hypothetical protein